MARVVLDATAILALLGEETGADTVRAHVDEAIVSAVSVAEVLETQMRHGVPGKLAADRLEAMPWRVVAFDALQARLASALAPAVREVGLGFGERASLALAQLLDLPVLTADRAWARLKLDILIQVIGAGPSAALPRAPLKRSAEPGAL